MTTLSLFRYDSIEYDGVPRYLADLWPEGWLIPSMLRRFRSMSREERAQQTLKMEELEAERDLVEGIRAGVAAAAKVMRAHRRWAKAVLMKLMQQRVCVPTMPGSSPPNFRRTRKNKSGVGGLATFQIGWPPSERGITTDRVSVTFTYCL